jgi:hypothetical protein
MYYISFTFTHPSTAHHFQSKMTLQLFRNSSYSVSADMGESNTKFESKTSSKFDSTSLFVAGNFDINMNSGSQLETKFDVASSLSRSSTTILQNSSCYNCFQTWRNSYWTVTFRVVLFPFVFWGIPFHLITFGREGITTKRAWVRSIFLEEKLLKVVLVHLPFLLIGLAMNGYVFYMVWRFFDNLVLQGQITSNFVEDLHLFGRLTPITYPVISVWIWGYSFRNLILSFDRSNPLINPYFKHNQDLQSSSSSIPNYRLYLGGVYFLIFLLQLSQCLLVINEIQQTAPEGSRTEFGQKFIQGIWIDYFLTFMYNLLLPVYICFCYAIQCELHLLSDYMKILAASGIQPEETHFDEIKKQYKSIAKQIVLINDILNIFYSYTIIILYGETYNETHATVVPILSNIIKESSETVSKDIRLFIGNLFCLIVQMILIFFTVWTAIGANDRARDLHVRLNDFVSQSQHNMSPELYRKVSHLNYDSFNSLYSSCLFDPKLTAYTLLTLLNELRDTISYPLFS